MTVTATGLWQQCRWVLMQTDLCGDAGEQQQPQCRPRAPLAAGVHSVGSRIPPFPKPASKAPQAKETLRAWG